MKTVLIRINPEDHDKVEKARAKFGLRTLAEALKRIIEEWRKK